MVLQCRTNASTNPVEIDVKVDLRNIRPEGDGYSHLAIDEVMIPHVLQGTAIAYFLLLFGLGAQMYFAKEHIAQTHWIFLATLAVCTISSLADYNHYFHYNKYGEDSDGVTLAANIFSFFSDFGLISSLLFLSMGWSLVRRNFQSRELQMACASLLFYFCFGMAAASCIDTGDVTCQGLSLVTLVVKSLLLLAIIVAMNYTVTLLKSMLYHSPWVASTPIQYARSKQFQIFRLMFIVYLLLPTVFILIKVSMYLWFQFLHYDVLLCDCVPYFNDESLSLLRMLMDFYRPPCTRGSKRGSCMR
jgi:hypothetical protein